MAAKYDFIKFEVQNRIGFIVLNRPEKRNALNDKMVEELKDAFDTAEANEEVKLVVLKAEGKVFCAGADLEYLEKISKNNYQENLQDSINLKDLFYKIYTFKKIVIARIHGHAIAGGAGIVSVCDFSFAASGISIGYTEVKLGFIPAIVAVFLSDKIGDGKTRELLLSGKLISAEEAKSTGLISEVVQAGMLEITVLDFAKDLIKSTSSASIAMTKSLIARMNSNLQDRLKLACEMNAEMRQSEDFKKGVAAFLQKETPNWN